MEPILPIRPEGDPLRAGPDPAFDDYGGLEALAALEQLTDLDSLDQALLEFAVHPSGAGMVEAHALVWSARDERFEGWRSTARRTPPPPLREALRPAGLFAPPPTREGTRRLLIPRERVRGALVVAWEQGGSAIGSAEDEAAPWGRGEVGAVVLRRGHHPYGLLVGQWAASLDREQRLAGLRRIERLVWTGATALARADELRRRARHTAGTAELVRAAGSALNLAELVRIAVRVTAQGTTARGSALWIAGDPGALRLEATHGPAGQREALARGLATLAGAVAVDGRPCWVEDVLGEARLPADTAAQLETVGLVPIAAYGRVLGVLAVYDRTALHPADAREFDRLDREWLASVGDLLGLAVDQGRRFEALRRASQNELELRGRVRRQERLAELGENAARLAREARNPLLAISAFAQRAQRSLPDGDPAREYLEIVVREAARLETMVAGAIEAAAGAPARLRMESLNAVLQEALQQAGETLVRRRVRLLKRLSPDLPQLLLDPERLRQVVRNVVAHAVDAVPVGGRIRVESRRVGRHVVVDVGYDGARRPGEAIEHLFVPFSADPVRAGVGLAAAQQIVREHGGEIRVRSESDGTTVVSFTLPADENADRRAGARERRGRRGDRRGAPSEPGREGA